MSDSDGRVRGLGYISVIVSNICEGQVLQDLKSSRSQCTCWSLCPTRIFPPLTAVETSLWVDGNPAHALARLLDGQ